MNLFHDFYGFVTMASESGGLPNQFVTSPHAPTPNVRMGTFHDSIGTYAILPLSEVRVITE